MRARRWKCWVSAKFLLLQKFSYGKIFKKKDNIFSVFPSWNLKPLYKHNPIRSHINKPYIPFIHYILIDVAGKVKVKRWTWSKYIFLRLIRIRFEGPCTNPRVDSVMDCISLSVWLPEKYFQIVDPYSNRNRNKKWNKGTGSVWCVWTVLLEITPYRLLSMMLHKWVLWG